MLAKSLAWLGKGIRGPLRNAIISDAVDPAHRGKAFGFHRAGDTLGAVLGPLIAAVFIAWVPQKFFGGIANAFYSAFWFTVIPGIGAAIVFWLLVKEIRFTPKTGLRLGASLGSMPGKFRSFLIGIGLFGIGDFAHSLLMVVATAKLGDVDFAFVVETVDGKYQATGTLLNINRDGLAISLILFAWRNFIQALAAFPAGWLGDKYGHRTILTFGYGLGALTMIGFAVLVTFDPTCREGWILLFALAGIYMAIQETVEPAIVPELVPDKQLQGTAFGVLAAVNGYGDVVASFTVGLTVYYFGWPIALGYAATMMTLGAIWMASISIHERRTVTP